VASVGSAIALGLMSMQLPVWAIIVCFILRGALSAAPGALCESIIMVKIGGKNRDFNVGLCSFET
jgi:hypothetical protein